MRTVNGTTIYSTVAEIIDPAHTALLVVDMQNDECHPDGWFAQQGRSVSGIAAIVPRVRALIDAARGAGVRVVFIQQTTLASNQSDPPAWLYFKTRDGRTRTDYNLDGTWGQEVLSELGRRPEDVTIKKYRPSAFHLTSLDLLLRAQVVESVVICGNTTQGCVLATTLDASFHDYFTVLVEDAVQSFSQEQHENALRFLGSRYDLMTAEAVVRSWQNVTEAA